MSLPPQASRSEWGVGLTWAQSYPEWPTMLRKWLADCRAIGLTVFTVIEERPGTIGLVATRPAGGDPLAYLTGKQSAAFSPPGEPVEYEGGF